MSLFPLPWHYIGGTICLLSPPRAGEAAAVRDARQDVITWLRRLAPADLGSVLAGRADATGKTLFDRIGEVLHARSLPTSFRWDPAALDGLTPVAVKVERGTSTTGDLSDEFILADGRPTGATLYIPWPYPLGQDVIPTLDGAVLAAPHVKINTVLDAVDWSVDCNMDDFSTYSGDLRDELVRVARNEVSRRRSYDLGAFVPKRAPGLYKSETRITFEAAAGWGVEIGTKRDKERDVAAMPRHPCGALDGVGRDCDG